MDIIDYLLIVLMIVVYTVVMIGAGITNPIILIGCSIVLGYFIHDMQK